MNLHSNAIILCGGHSTRLPNKLLIPSQRKGETGAMLFNVLAHVMECGFKHITFCLPDTTMGKATQAMLMMVCKAWGCTAKLSFCWDQYHGLVTAINNAILRDMQNAVFCGDNVYEDEMYDYPNAEHAPIAIVRMVPEEHRKHLDFVGENDIFYKREDAHRRMASLTTPWILPAGRQLPDLDGDIIKALNIMFTRSHLIPLANWTDLGTEETYLAHWSSK